MNALNHHHRRATDADNEPLRAHRRSGFRIEPHHVALLSLAISFMSGIAMRIFDTALLNRVHQVQIQNLEEKEKVTQEKVDRLTFEVSQFRLEIAKVVRNSQETQNYLLDHDRRDRIRDNAKHVEGRRQFYRRLQPDD